MAPITATAMTVWIDAASRATTLSPRMAARQKTRLVMATCSRWLNSGIRLHRTHP